MSRRTRNDEIELGSDSFLDIIANIVGILIILIVIAGVKVSRQPVTTQPASIETTATKSTETEPEADPVAMLEPAEDEPTETVQERQFEVPAPPTIFVSQPQQPTLPVARAVMSFDGEESALATIDKETKTLEARLARLTTERTAVSSSVDARMAKVTEAQHGLSSLRTEVEAKREEARKLRRRLAKAEQQKITIEHIEHKVTPLGREVTGKEVHFRISDGKVSAIPIEKLIAELKRDASKRQRVLMHTPTYQGRVGPIRGYRMNYEIARRRRSMDPLDYSPGGFRVVVSEWKIEPTRDLEEEKLTQAVRPGSLFQRRLMTVEHNTTVTFWVYPDSFAEFRELQKLVHNEGLTVAGRPLPFGVPIAGSPSGSKSSGQ